jgi:hypothetical protein
VAVLDGHYEHPGALLRSAWGGNYRSLWQSDAVTAASLLAEEKGVVSARKVDGPAPLSPGAQYFSSAVFLVPCTIGFAGGDGFRFARAILLFCGDVHFR